MKTHVLILVLSLAHLGTAVADVELTQHCIARGTCREGNPLMPQSRAGMYSVDFSLVGLATWQSYRAHKRGERLWWLAPTAGIAAHSAGIGTGLQH
jgi:hypothetical protein